MERGDPRGGALLLDEAEVRVTDVTEVTDERGDPRGGALLLDEAEVRVTGVTEVPK